MVQAIVVIITLPIIVGLGGWLLVTQVEQEKDLAVQEASLTTLAESVKNNSESVHQLTFRITRLEDRQP